VIKDPSTSQICCEILETQLEKLEKLAR